MGNGYEIDLKQLLLIIRRKIKIIAACIGVFFVMALLYVCVADNKYIAETQVFLDKKTTDKIAETSTIERSVFDAALITSEVEVLLSGRVTEAVIRAIKEKGYLKEETENDVPLSKIIEQLQSGLRVSRVGETYVLSVKYTAKDPQEAADIANAYADAYIADQIGALSEMATRNAEWLNSKVQELRQQAINAEKDVMEYRTKYNTQSQGKVSLSESDTVSNEEKRDMSLVELRTLEKEAETFKALHDDYLEKFKGASAQETFPITEARIITHALPPVEASSPKAKLALGAAIIIGAGLGLLIALILDTFDRTLRRAGQAGREVGVSFLGFIPKDKGGKKTFREEPSYFDTIRVIRNAVDDRLGDERKKVIGVISAQSDAVNLQIGRDLAELISLSRTCVFVNADFTASSQDSGAIANILSEGFKPEQIARGKGGMLAAVSLGAVDRETIRDGLAFEKVRTTVEKLHESFDYIIFNLPPMVAKADVYTFSKAIDIFVVIGEWGKTLPNELNFYLSQNGIDKDRIAGLALKDTDIRAMEKFYGHKFAA